jgi:glutamate dehydrogenase
MGPTDHLVPDDHRLPGDGPRPETRTALARAASAPGGVWFDIRRRGGGEPYPWHLLVYRAGGPLRLTEILPVIACLGVEVVDESPQAVVLPPGGEAWVYDFRLDLGGMDLSPAQVQDLCETLARLAGGRLEADGFNRLNLATGLSWRQVNILRAYARYLSQVGLGASQQYIEQTLIGYPAVTRALVELFHARHDPARAPAPADEQDIADGLEQMLRDVPNLVQDEILRTLATAIRATARTNAFMPGRGDDVVTLAFKIEPRTLPVAEPRPAWETWVHSARTEGIHLRFGAVARGGIRWSDRPEDFRSEVMQLVKAQVIKNAVIVPTGAKGGFIVKGTSRDHGARWSQAGADSYAEFIGALLDVTDNIVSTAEGDKVPPPVGVVRHDSADPYLVVAADKGTATYSDVANAIAAERGYWLGDAFASGGSNGYDHKAMGITARGAWRSVEHHFRELELDPTRDTFSVVGIGDMSGDVFGNGMLLSDRIRLVAAFDHRHVFLDPDPDPAVSLAERRRLFERPRSSWGDYARDLISGGGGVYARTVKAVPIAAPVARALGLDPAVTSLTPDQLISAILRAPVELLWSAGIGTWVKASGEQHTDAGDRANDAVRVDADELRAAVVVEGGNLGLTQRARVEFAARGGRVHTDAVDNSAGVDTSDHEVNLKIALDRAVAHGLLTRAGRDELLVGATDEVAAQVLRDNYEQNLLIGVSRRYSADNDAISSRVIDGLEQRGRVHRALDALPTGTELADRVRATGVGLHAPEICVVTQQSKIELAGEIADSELCDDPWFAKEFRDYFPPAVAVALGDELDGHPLRREITATVLANAVVNRAGFTFVARAREETGAGVAEVVRAHEIARILFGTDDLRAEIEKLDGTVPAEAQYAANYEVGRVVDRAVHWFLQLRSPVADIAAEIEAFAPVFDRLAPKVNSLVRPAEAAYIRTVRGRLARAGLPDGLALRVASLLSCFHLLNVVRITGLGASTAEEVAAVYFPLSETFFIDELLTLISRLDRSDRWQSLARTAIRYDVYEMLSLIAAAALRSTDTGAEPSRRVAAWLDDNAAGVDAARAVVAAAVGTAEPGLAALSSAVRALRRLLTTAS